VRTCNKKTILLNYAGHMDEHEHHEDLIKAVAEEYSEILKNSEQGMYIYLDDNHKVCNDKFATLLEYGSVEEWVSVRESFPDAFVTEESQETLVTAYQKAMEQYAGSEVNVTWKKKPGGTVETTVVLVPISHNGHVFALHFVSM
jgi:hypothetical protein